MLAILGEEALAEMALTAFANLRIYNDAGAEC